MEFLHLATHRAQLRTLIAAAQASDGPTAVLLLLKCPHCRAVYFAEPSSGPVGQGVKALDRTAREQLGRECPDHPHRFAVLA